MPLRSLRSWISRLLSAIPLRTVLIVQLVLLISLAVGLTGALSYYSGKRAVRDIVGQLEGEISNRIGQTLETYLRVPQLVTNINADLVKLGLLNLDNLSETQAFLWSMLQQFNDHPCREQPELAEEGRSDCTNLALISIATQAGDYIDLEFNPATRAVRTTLRDLEQDPQTRTWRVNAWGKKTDLVEVYDYNPLERDWYKEAVQAGTLVWSGPFATAPPDPYAVVSVDRPVTNVQGDLLGVTGVAVSLSGLDQFLQSLRVGKTGQAFVIEPNGELIATSTTEQPFLDAGQQRKAIDSENLLTQSTARDLLAKFGDFNNISRLQTTDFFLHQARQFVRIEPLRTQQLRSSTDQSGLNWLIVTVIPEDDFTEQIKAITRKTALICLGALALAIPLGVITSRWITKPILQLSRAADALARGDWDRLVTVKRGDALGVLVNAFNHMRDQLKQSHQQLEGYSRGLEQKNEQLETLEAELRRQLNLFLHAVSHDLRNPVLGMSMVLNNLSTQAGDEIIMPRKVLERMQDSSKHQLDLINSLIDTHAAEIWGITLHPKPVTLRRLVEAAVADLQPMLDKEKAHLDNQIPADLPLVQVDSLQLGRVYQNLLANALKHNPNGLTIVLTAQSRPGWIYCTVADNGVGIPPEQCERLFDPYFRGSAKPKSVGLGLGLYLCQQIVQAHGGEIGVASEPGKSTTFWFTLPASLKSSNAKESTQQKSEPG
jgi:signal transduction histidine kinase